MLYLLGYRDARVEYQASGVRPLPSLRAGAAVHDLPADPGLGDSRGPAVRQLLGTKQGQDRAGHLGLQPRG